MRDFSYYSLYIGSGDLVRVGVLYCRTPSPPMRLDQDLKAPDALILD